MANREAEILAILLDGGHVKVAVGETQHLFRGEAQPEGYVVWVHRSVGPTRKAYTHHATAALLVDAVIAYESLCPLCGEDRNHPSQHGNHRC